MRCSILVFRNKNVDWEEVIWTWYFLELSFMQWPLLKLPKPEVLKFDHLSYSEIMKFLSPSLSSSSLKHLKIMHWDLLSLKTDVFKVLGWHSLALQCVYLDRTDIFYPEYLWQEVCQCFPGLRIFAYVQWYVISSSVDMLLVCFLSTFWRQHYTIVLVDFCLSCDLVRADMGFFTCDILYILEMFQIV